VIKFCISTPLRLTALLGLTLFLSCVPFTSAQTAPSNGSRILLVLPFENRTGQPNLEWLREAAPEVLNARLNAAGFAPISTDERLYAFDHLGLPPNYQPTRASSLRLAQTLDVDSIIVGSYIANGTGIIVEAQLIDLPHLRMTPAVSAKGEMTDLLNIYDQLAWRLTRQLDPNFPVAEQTFIAASAGLRLDAFEQFIRGVTEPDHAERLEHLRRATLLSPNYSRAWMALGRELYLSEQYDDAAIAFAHVQRSDPNALEAGFDRGVALLFSGKYSDAEDAFSTVARVLPLPEVLNNQAVAESRRGQDATELFRRAALADPSLADFHFNLAVSLHRHNRKDEALAELKQDLLLRPADQEALDLQDIWADTTTAATPASATTGKPTTHSDQPDPLERIERTFNAAAFRQAAQMMDQMQSARRAELSPHDRALALALEARSYLDRGLLLESERLYRAAIEIDATLSSAHTGMGVIRERTGDLDSARAEARTSLRFEATADAWILLAQIDLAQNHLDDATADVSEALKLEPTNRTALEIRSTIAQKQGKI
jgi:tetratricopeptide (TPR) repeat protein